MGGFPHFTGGQWKPRKAPLCQPLPAGGALAFPELLLGLMQGEPEPAVQLKVFLASAELENRQRNKLQR